jgi:hypothetical protein
MRCQCRFCILPLMMYTGDRDHDIQFPNEYFHTVVIDTVLHAMEVYRTKRSSTQKTWIPCVAVESDSYRP